jgi:hypothetical protein
LLKNLVTSNWNWYMGDFLGIFSLELVPLLMDHFKDNFRNNYLIFKLN